MVTKLLVIGLVGIPLLGASGMEQSASTAQDKVTISTSRDKRATPIASPWILSMRIRVENLSDADLEVNPEMLSAKQASGQARKCLTVEEANELIRAQSSRKVGVFADAVGGPLLGRNITDRQLDAGKSHVIQTAFSFGKIPPHSFKEGLVYFEGPGQKIGKGFRVTISSPKLFEGELPVGW